MNYRSWYNKGHLGRSIAGKMHQKGHARWQGGAPFDYSDLGIISVSCPGDFWETAHDRLLPNPYLFTISERTISLDLQETQRLKQRCQIAQETIMNKNETCIIFEILTGDEKQEMRAITAGDTHRHAHTLTRSHDNIITTCVSPGCEQLHCYWTTDCRPAERALLLPAARSSPTRIPQPLHHSTPVFHWWTHSEQYHVQYRVVVLFPSSSK